MKLILSIILFTFLCNTLTAQYTCSVSVELGVLNNKSKFINHTGNALRKSDFTMNLALLRNINFSVSNNKNFSDYNGLAVN